MKKFYLIILSLLTAISLSAQQRFSSVSPSGHTLWYRVINNNSVSVDFCQDGGNYSLSGSLIIPDSVYNGGITYVVRGIIDGIFGFADNGVFKNQSLLTSVTLPSSMTTIGVGAFWSCTNLSVVNLNEGLSVIGTGAFGGCVSLDNVTIPDSVISVGIGAFAGCSSLSTVTLSANASIADEEFEGCTSLTNIVIPDGVRGIGISAFLGCTNLTQISIPNSVTAIGASAFSGCSSLQTLVLPNALPNIPNGMCNGCTNLESVTIPNTVAYIQTNAFNGCSSLFSVTVPNSVLSIETNAFGGVFNVVYNGPATGTTWGAYAVNGFIQDSILYNDNTISTLVRAHHNIHTATIPQSVTTISNGAFQNCTNITGITLGNNITSIGNNAFAGCTALTNVTIGNNITAIPDHMFDGCTSLTTSPLTNNIQTIGAYAFYNTGLSTIIIPQQCTYIGEMALPTVFTIVVRPINPPTLGNYAFGYPGNRVFYVPCGRLAVYQGAWTQYGNNMVEPTVDFDLNVQTSEGGQAYATSSISCQDSTATIQATSDYGYHFDHWSDGITDNPRTIHVVSDTTVTAIFARNSYTITLHSADTTMGSTTGGGTYLYGETATLMAVPVEHYHLLRWTTYHWGYEQTVDHQNPLSVVVTENMEYTAYFAIDTYYVNVVPNEVTRGSVTGGGYAEYGSPITVTATPYSGYQFVRWSNGAEYNPYTFAVTNDMTLEAVFMEEGTVYHVEATSDNSVMGTVTGGGPYATGETAVLTAVAYPGYHFIRWQDNVTENPRSYLVTHDASFVAYFEPNVGIGEIEDDGVNVYVNGGRIIVENVNGMVVSVYDMMGRLVATASGETVSVPMPVGVYLVKVGTLPARKVAVIR